MSPLAQIGVSDDDGGPHSPRPAPRISHSPSHAAVLHSPSTQNPLARRAPNHTPLLVARGVGLKIV